MTTKYGKSSEAVTAHIRRIIAPPTINGANASRIHEFYRMLINSIQSLETMEKSADIQGYVRMTLETLHIRSGLVQSGNNLQDWKLSRP